MPYGRLKMNCGEENYPSGLTDTMACLFPCHEERDKDADAQAQEPEGRDLVKIETSAKPD
jgi:hypothetical protein